MPSRISTDSAGKHCRGKTDGDSYEASDIKRGGPVGDVIGGLVATGYSATATGEMENENASQTIEEMEMVTTKSQKKKIMLYQS